MSALAKILLPVDFSERAVGAARYARCLAERCHSEIVLLHALPPLHAEFGPDVAGAMLIDVYRSRSEQAARELNGFPPDGLGGIPTRRLVLNGDPAAEIVRFAHAEPVDLIVMPTHGYGPFRRFILGSNTAKVLHDADCPVCTGVHLEEAAHAADPSFDSVLCAIDLGAHSAKTLAWAVWFQRQFGARLTLLHAGPADMHGAAREELDRLQYEAGTAADLLLEDGDPAHTICSAAARLQAGLLVIGRGSASGHFGRLRTNSYAIVRQSPCPVISV